jgi:hypothetical protein
VTRKTPPPAASRPMNAPRKQPAMTPAIKNNPTSSDQTAHTIGPPTGHQHTWEMSWLPGPCGGGQPGPPPACETAGP